MIPIRAAIDYHKNRPSLAEAGVLQHHLWWFTALLYLISLRRTLESHVRIWKCQFWRSDIILQESCHRAVNLFCQESERRGHFGKRPFLMSSIRVDQGDMSLSGSSGETDSMSMTLRRQEHVTTLIRLPRGLGSPALPHSDTPMSIDLRERLNVMMQNYNCTSCPFPV